MHKIEREIIKAAKFTPRKKYADRQEYLKAVFLCTTNLSDDDFNELTDETANWINECVKVHNANKKADLPEFDEELTDEESEDDSESDDEADAASDDEESDEADESEDDEPDEDEAVDEDDEGDEAADDASSTDEESEDDASDEPGDDDDDEADAEEPAPAAKPAKKAKPNGKAPAEKEPKAAKKAVAPKIPKPEKQAKDPKPPKQAVDATLDKWGCIEGSKNGQALAMFEKGATSREVKEKLGGTYYNILGKMQENGHRLTKEGSLFTLTHKDDLNKAKAAPKKAKK